MSQFNVGQSYTRREIHDAVGGDLQSYLPRVAGRVVAGCFDRRMNPTAPAEVLVGEGKNVIAAARQLANQGGTIPVFMKREPNAWEYAGVFEVDHYSENVSDVAALAEAAGQPGIGALYLREVSV